jgi:hypothetical protein
MAFRCALRVSRRISRQLRLRKNSEPIDLFCGRVRGLVSSGCDLLAAFIRPGAGRHAAGALRSDLARRPQRDLCL